MMNVGNFDVSIKLDDGTILSETFETEELRDERFGAFITELNDPDVYFIEFTNEFFNTDKIQRTSKGAIK